MNSKRQRTSQIKLKLTGGISEDMPFKGVIGEEK